MNTSWTLDNFLSIGFVSIFTLAILEILLRKFFPLAYFRYGIPMIWRTLSLFPHHKPLHPQEFQPVAVDSKPYIEIQSLNEFEYALWPSKFQRRSRKRMSNYSPLTRGYISFDTQDNVLKLRVYLNWFVILFIPMWFGVVILMSSWFIKILFTILGAIVVSVLYHREREQYFEIWHRLCGELGLIA